MAADPKKVAEALKTPAFRKELAANLKKALAEYRDGLVELRKARPKTPTADHAWLHGHGDYEEAGESRPDMEGYPGAGNHYIAVPHGHPVTDHPSFVGSTQDASKWGGGRVTSFHDYDTLARRATEAPHRIFAIKWHAPDSVDSVHSGRSTEDDGMWYDDSSPLAWSGTGKFSVLHEVKGGPNAGVDESTPKAKNFRIPPEAQDQEKTPKGGGVDKSQRTRTDLKKALSPQEVASAFQDTHQSPQAPVGVHPTVAALTPTTAHPAAHAGAVQAFASAPNGAPSPNVSSDTGSNASHSQANISGGVNWQKVREAAGITKDAMRNPVGTLQAGLDQKAQEAAGPQPATKSEIAPGKKIAKATMPSNKPPAPAKPAVPMASHPAGAATSAKPPSPAGHGPAKTPAAPKLGAPAMKGELPMEKSGLPVEKSGPPMDKAIGPWGKQTRGDAASAMAHDVKRQGIGAASGSNKIAALATKPLVPNKQNFTPVAGGNFANSKYPSIGDADPLKLNEMPFFKGELCASCGKDEHLGKCEPKGQKK